MSLDELGRGFGIAGQHGLAHRFLKHAAVAKPVPGRGMDRALLRFAAHAEALNQGFAQQGMQSEPGFTFSALYRYKKEVLAFQPCQQRGQSRFLLGPVAQRSA
ncbi:hypothetical protein [Cupriavidus necator]|uniref:hypothetical protein n=1 Tax=Cupriavidus necator TaxID=106590 RepID=UPI0030F3E89F